MIGGDTNPAEEMVPMYGTVLSGDTPCLIADLRSIEHDLRYASRLFARVAEVDAEDDPDLRQALFDAGAIAYRRGFTTGRSLISKGESRRKVPDEIIDSLEQGSRRAHEAVLERANTHIAHRVSDAEQGRVILLLNNPTFGREVQGVAWFFARFVGPDSDDALRAAHTAELIAESIAALVESVQDQLLETAKIRDVDALYATAKPMGDQIQGQGQPPSRG